METNIENDNNFEKQLFSMTTIIECQIIKNEKVYTSQGSGFYYTEQTPTDPTNTGPQWHKIDKHWLVTNRHVVLPKIDGVECVPDKFTFSIREYVEDKIQWVPITLSKEEILSSLKLHKYREVDVALIDVTLYITERLSQLIDDKKKSNFILSTNLSNRNLPDNQPITVDVTSDIIVASYPRGFYDQTNKFPIVKSGIVASAWGFPFNGQPMFQIDAQLFPGSSGGLVISKPTNIAMINGALNYSKTKQFVLLGVYSGEFKWYEEINIGGNMVKMGNSYGLGNVWYSYLIPQIISDGVSFEI